MAVISVRIRIDPDSALGTRLRITSLRTGLKYVLEFDESKQSGTVYTNHVQTRQRVGSVFRHENRLVVFEVPLGGLVFQSDLDDVRVTG